MIQSKDLAGEKGVVLHTHLAETMDEEQFYLKRYGRRPFELMEDYDHRQWKYRGKEWKINNCRCGFNRFKGRFNRTRDCKVFKLGEDYMYSLLVVDDEELIRRGLKYSIKWETMGFMITGEAVDGEDALQKLAENHFDVILTDIRMPGVDGLELIKNIRERFPAIKIVIISGYSDFEYAVSALKMKVDDYILKPIKKENIEAIFKIMKEKLDRETINEMKFKTGVKAAEKYVLTRLLNNDFRGKDELYEILNK